MSFVTAPPVKVDNSTLEKSAGVLRVKDLGITEGKIAALAVTEGKIGVGAVVDAKTGSGVMKYADTRNKHVAFTYDTSTASGTLAITGVGFTPLGVLFLAGEYGTKDMSIGAQWGAAPKKCISDGNAVSAGTYFHHTDRCLHLSMDGSITNQARGSISSYDVDGFTITWTKAGSPTGTAEILAIPFR